MRAAECKNVKCYREKFCVEKVHVDLASGGSYVHFGGFGWDVRHAHAPCPPSLLQLTKELLLGGVYTVTGGMSGNWL